MSGPNKILVAAAGSGKTDCLVKEALQVANQSVLITTYTESNEEEIRQRFLRTNGHIPSNVVIMTWFTFLITHAVKPFQGRLFEFDVNGLQFVQNRSGLRLKDWRGRPIYWGEDDFVHYYFNGNRQIYSDKLAKLAIRCDEASGGSVFDRLGRIFGHIFVDEVQDLAGYDLDLLTALFKSSARVLLVGDPRQVTYLTHHETRYGKYADGGIVAFLQEELPKRVRIEIDQHTLAVSHRNNAEICRIASKLYPGLNASEACACQECRRAVEHHGLFIVKPTDYGRYLDLYKPMQLRDKVTTKGINPRFPAMNFGESKGRGFDRVIIRPTTPMLEWLRDSGVDLTPQTRARFYVALTRARHSVAIVADWPEGEMPEGFSLFVEPK